MFTKLTFDSLGRRARKSGSSNRGSVPAVSRDHRTQCPRPAGLDVDNFRDFPAEAGSLIGAAKVMAHSEVPEQSHLSLSDMWHPGIPVLFMYF